jgi:hypothetical protein
MNRSEFFALSGMSAAAGALPAASGSIAGVKVPDSYAARQAAAQAQEVEDPQVFRHSLRSFYFAELIAQAQNIRHDPEVVYVAAVLHDIGLSKERSTPHVRFEIDGANAAKGLLSGGRAQVAWDAVVLHSIFSIARFKEPEVHLVSAGVITDVGGAFLKYLPTDRVSEVVAALPRRGFNQAFLNVLSDYARRKPDTVGGTFVEDVAMHVVPGYERGDFYVAMQGPDAFDARGSTGSP